MPCAGVTQRYLDCGLHEVATGDKDSVADQKARVFIAELLVQCGADPDNRQHGCGGTPLHHTRASKSNVPRRGKRQSPSSSSPGSRGAQSREKPPGSSLA